MGLTSHQNTIGKNQEWLTPRYILDRLEKFDLDPCAPKRRPWRIAEHHFTVNGLEREWFGRVWLNPPFDRYKLGLWLKKMAEHNNGIALIAARTETVNFYNYVWAIATGVLFIKNRPHFCYVDGTMAKFNSGAPICLIAYGKSNLKILIESGLGVTVKQI